MQIDYAKDIVVAMPMYNLIEYSDNTKEMNQISVILSLC